MVPVFAGDAAGTSELFARGVNLVEGTIVASVFHPAEPRPEVRRFVEAFERRYRKKPDAAAALGYDAVRLLARAIAEGGSAEPHRIAATLHDARGWPGVTGTFSFTDAGDLRDGTIVTMIARRGAFDFFPALSAPRATAVDVRGGQ